jgi:dCMP deaminase
MRISREQMLMEWAYTASKRGTCGRLAVGAIIARDSRPISAGYVGPAAGELHCDENLCNISVPCTRTVHAEINALEFARRFGINVEGADMFITDSPCPECAQAITDARIARVFFDREYRVRLGITRLLVCGIDVQQVLANGMSRRITKLRVD